MRFLSKRPKIDDIAPEMNDLVEVMLWNGFMVLDLFIVSLFFSYLLFSVLHSFVISILTFLCSFIFFTILHHYISRTATQKEQV